MKNSCPITMLAVAAGFGQSILRFSSAEEVVYNWKLVSVLGNQFSPDCQNLQQQRRSLFLAQSLDENGNEVSEPTFPGPAIEATEGDTIVVRIVNDHPTLGTSIHFHGIHQVGTPWNDGPSFISQCPLSPFQTQEYRFEAYPPGTHYWHAHTGMEIEDGLSGPLIVHPKNAPDFEYDEDRMLFLQDFYSENSEEQRAGLDNFPFTWIGNPDSHLINGKGLAAACVPPDGSSAGDVLVCLDTCNDTLAWIPTIEVEADMVYRFRIINSGQLTMQNVAIVGHNMTIVEVEGTIVDPPITVSNYDVSPGQRVSVLVTANQAPGDYLIETIVRERNITGLTGRAILHYANDSAPALPSVSPDHPLWNESEEAKAVEDSLRTKDPSSYPEFAALSVPEETVQRWVIVGTQNLLLNDQGEPVQLRWAINNISDIHNGPEPLLSRALSLAKENGWPSDLGDGTVDVPKNPPIVWNYTELVTDPTGPGSNLGQQGLAVIRLSEGNVFEIVLQNARALNGAAEFHPWHVHGHSFWIVGRGEGIFDPAVDPANYNLENPLLRDTATLWPLGWTALRMVANNPGAWLFHCHLNSHLTMGMNFAIIVDPAKVGEPDETVPLCGFEANPYSDGDTNEDGPSEATDGAWSLSQASITFTLFSTIAIGALNMLIWS